jgi:hypothetical protein
LVQASRGFHCRTLSSFQPFAIKLELEVKHHRLRLPTRLVTLQAQAWFAVKFAVKSSQLNVQTPELPPQPHSKTSPALHGGAWGCPNLSSKTSRKARPYRSRDGLDLSHHELPWSDLKHKGTISPARARTRWPTERIATMEQLAHEGPR